VAQQVALTIPFAGAHTVGVTGQVISGEGNWRVDDSSLGMEVDGVEAAPASGFDFALCSALGPKDTNNSQEFRQSVITIPNAGVHHVQVFARGSDIGDWELAPGSMVVE
jgi:hypothetical protein